MPTKNPRNAQGVINVELYKRVYETAQRVAPKKGKSIKDFVNDAVLMTIEKYEFLEQYAPSLSLVSMTATSLFIEDSMKKRTAEVVLKDGSLVCYLDESDECIHVKYALALPEVGHLNIKQLSVVPMSIKDDATGKMAIVDFQQGHLYCNLCKSYGCIHVDIADLEFKKKVRAQSLRRQK